MDNSVRIQYLQAMGITVWIPKQAPATATGECYAAPQANLNNPASADTSSPTQHVCPHCTLANLDYPYASEQSPELANWLLVMDGPNLNSEANQLLMDMLHALQPSANHFKINAVLKCSPSPDPTLQSQHDAACRQFLEQQIQRLQPKIILLMGPETAQCLLQTPTPLVQLRGSMHKFAAISTIVTYHPQFLLHSLLEKRNAWQDLQLAMAAYREIN